MRIIWLFIIAAQLFGQTQVNLATQSRNADFGSFLGTRPWRVAATLPATCQPGEAVFINTAAPGQHLYVCGSPNVWEINSAVSTAILEFVPFKQSAGTLAIGPFCSSLTPCRALLGDRMIILSTPATITLSGPPGSGIIYVWIDEHGVRAGTSNSGTITCNTACQVVTGAVTTFPARSLPLAAVTFTQNVVDSISGNMDLRSIYTAQRVEAGPSANLTVTSNNFTGATEVDLNGTLDFGGMTATRILRRGTAALRSPTCSTGDLFYQTDASAGIYECFAANSWRGPLATLGALHLEAGPSANLIVTSNSSTGATEVDLSGTLDFGGMEATRILRRGTAALRSPTCSTGDLFYQTDASTGIYECFAANSWRGPLATLDKMATVDVRSTALAQTADAPPITLLAAGHASGMYRVCSAATVTLAAVSGTLDLVLSWRSSAQPTNLIATLTSIPVDTTAEAYGCRVILSTGAADVSMDASDVGTAQYDLQTIVERLQ